MNETREYICYLWQQLLDDKITTQELDDLTLWLRRNPDDEFSISFLESHMANHKAVNTGNYKMWNERLKMILQADISSINQEQDSVIQLDDMAKQQGKKFRVLKTGLVRFAAAAMVIVSIGAYLWTRNTTTKDPEAEIKQALIQPDISPGGQRAYLIMSNGKKFELTGQNTTIADAGTIVTAGNGEIKYGKSNEVNFHTMTTPRGGQYKLVLPDGSAVWLNAASSITYPTLFTGNNREVSVAGEAYFEIAKNKKHPFIIRSDDAEILVLGTSFNFNNYSEDEQHVAHTTLIEGSLRVSSHSTSRILIPGQQAEVSGNNIVLNNNVDIEKVLAWKNGEMILSESTTRKLMNEISRWYDVDVIYEGEIPDRKFFGSVSRSVPLTSLLNVLRAYGINTSLEGKKLIVQ